MLAGKQVCRELARCEFLPEKLPYEKQSFDLVYSFSVFTHLSEVCHERSLAAIYEVSEKPEGLFVATIRPPSYLDSRVSGWSPLKWHWAPVTIEHSPARAICSPPT